MQNMPGLQEMMQQFQQMQQRLKEKKAELARKTTTANAGGGMVKATVNGAGKLINIEIEDEVLTSGDQEMLQDLVVAAVNQALDASRRMADEAQGDLAGGLPMGGFEDIMGKLFGGG